MTYLPNLLPQPLSPPNISLIIRNLPKRATKHTSVDLLEPDPHIKILNALRKEELIAEERFDNRRYTGAQTSSRRTTPTMMHRRVHLLEQPVVGRRLDLEDFRWEGDFRLGRVFGF